MADYPGWITSVPLQRDWNLVRGNALSRLCEIKAIAIHFTHAPGQKARDTRKFLQERVKDNPSDRYDLEPSEQGSPLVGAHFIIDDSEILALAPSVYFTFYHVGDQRSRSANTGYWDQNKDKFIRGANFYTIGIEHCHADETGKLSPAVLQKSHQLVRWLLKEHGAGLMIGRHYDFTGKACPLYYAPCLLGKNDYDGLKPEFQSELTEVQMKTFRWTKLLEYYKQSNAANIPMELL